MQYLEISYKCKHITFEFYYCNL